MKPLQRGELLREIIDYRKRCLLGDLRDLWFPV